MQAREFILEQNQTKNRPDPTKWSWHEQDKLKHQGLLDPNEIERLEYLSGKCAILAIALHEHNPKRFKLGVMIEYFDTVPDLRPDEQEWDELPGERKFDLMYKSQHWVMGHAYVQDTQTGEFVDARGRFPDQQGVHRGFSTHSKLGRVIFPTTVTIAANVGTVEMTDDGVRTVKGQEYLDRFVNTAAQQRALKFAERNLDIDVDDQHKNPDVTDR